MGQPQGPWQPGSITWPGTAPTLLGVPSIGRDPWNDTRDGAVGRCRVDLPIDAPLPDDLGERGWAVVDRYRDRNRWVDVVIIEGDTLPRHMAGEYMTEWRSFDDLREAVARSLAEAIRGPQEPDLAQLGQFTVPMTTSGSAPGILTGLTTTTNNYALWTGSSTWFK